MKVLVTGATGFLGSWLVRELLEAGHTPRALVRRTSRLDNLTELFSRGAERAEGDVLDAASVRGALSGCDAVIHTAGIPHFSPDDVPNMMRVNVEGVTTVLGEAQRAGVERAVLTSSVAAMGGGVVPRVADESTPSNVEQLGLHYSLSKYQGEQAAMRLCAAGLPLVTLRPAVILGPGDIYRSSTSTILALVRRKLPVIVEGGASFGDVREIARAHVAALTRGRIGEAYIVGGHNLRISELAARVAEISGVPAPRCLPYALALPLVTAAELSLRALGRHPDMSRQLLQASRLYTWVSSEKAAAELGYKIPPFADMLRDTLRFFLENGRLKPTTPELQRIAQQGGAPSAAG
jgi:dihydroflavonol-4-reductase